MKSSEKNPDFEVLLRALTEQRVEFIVIGGLAAIVHGSARTTTDLDVIYRRSEENYSKIVSALKDLHPYLRGAPPDLPFMFDTETLKSGLNFTLMTSAGAIDLLGEVPGGDYSGLAESVESIRLFNKNIQCISLLALIELKKKAGRPKDIEAIAELEALHEEMNSQKD